MHIDYVGQRPRGHMPKMRWQRMWHGEGKNRDNAFRYSESFCAEPEVKGAGEFSTKLFSAKEGIQNWTRRFRAARERRALGAEAAAKLQEERKGFAGKIPSRSWLGRLLGALRLSKETDEVVVDRVRGQTPTGEVEPRAPGS